MIDRTKDAIQQVQMLGITEPQNTNILMNSLNYIRTINGLAGILGIEQRIKIISEEDNIDDLDFLSLIQMEIRNK